MASHNCRIKWDPDTKADVLKGKLETLTNLHGKGWARDLADQPVYLSLRTLKSKLEEARGVMSAFTVNFQLGSIPADNLMSLADSINTGLLMHALDNDHINANNPVGQFGWITKVDPDSPFTVMNNLLNAVRDCLDNPPGGGSGPGVAASHSKSTTARKPGRGTKGVR